jgi:hypothetical protein
MSDQSGLAGLVAEIRGASRNIELADNRHSKRLDGIEASINELYKKIYSLQWQHNAHPPDFHLSLVQALPEQWINAANLTLLAALRRSAPQAIDWTEMQDIVPTLDAFEEAMASKTARRH